MVCRFVAVVCWMIWMREGGRMLCGMAVLHVEPELACVFWWFGLGVR